MQATGEGIGARIRSARRLKRFAVNELAHRISRSPHTLYIWEQGKALPQVLDAIALAHELEVDLRWLLLGDAARRRRSRPEASVA